MQYDNGEKVIDGIYIGSLETAKRLPNHNPHGIDFVINLSGSMYETSIPTFYVIIPDAPIEYYDIDEFVKRFSVATRMLEKKHAAGHRVLVHCHEGINRSATVIALYLINHGYDPKSVYTLLGNVNKKRNRPALTNESFRYLITFKYAVSRW